MGREGYSDTETILMLDEGDEETIDTVRTQFK